MVDNEFLDIFLDEAREILERWESACIRLEKEAKPETISELFRAAHNIKGSALSVGLEAFGSLVHKAEDLITKCSTGVIPVSGEVISALLDCQKILSDWIEALRASKTYSGDVSNICDRLLKLQGESVQSTKGEIEGFELFDDADAKDSEAPKDLGTILIESGNVSQEDIERAVTQQNRKLGEVLVDSGVVSKEAVKIALEQQKSSGQKIDETIRVSLRKLDSIIRLIGELSIQHSIVRNAKETSQLNEPHTHEAIGLSHKVIQDLQGEAMALRMQPLESLFQRMERVSRDVARQQGKTIDVVLKGTDVELDKTVIERMKDPLVHILRNAVDHGLEDHDARKKSGKNQTATITIEGIQTAANVSIMISDDGRGLDEEKILKKALEKGLISSQAKPTTHEIHQMIFMPGFSTADAVTDISGRGVGMDVVKRTVDELGGAISIESTRGKGTQFLISLPSTLSILDALVVSLGDQLYAVPIQDVEEVVDMSSTKIVTTTQKGKVINLRGKILPLENLGLYLPNAEAKLCHMPGVALVVRHNSRAVAFQVDKVAGQQSIVVRQLEGKLAEVPGFAGGTILSSGEPSMIIHLPQILRSYLLAVSGG